MVVSKREEDEPLIRMSPCILQRMVNLAARKSCLKMLLDDMILLSFGGVVIGLAQKPSTTATLEVKLPRSLLNPDCLIYDYLLLFK